MTSRPVALSRDLPNNRVMRAEVDGLDLAVWRNSKGALAVWNNRCPHRGMRLSHGFVRGDRLACLYHGWQYGSSGKCKYIPAHPELEPPETICAKSYSIMEEQGVIWVSVESDATAATETVGFDPLRSLNILKSEAQVAQAITNTRFEDGGVQPVSEGLYQAGPKKFCVLSNPVSASETLVHVLSETGANLSERCALSRWAEAMRRMAESMEAGNT